MGSFATFDRTCRRGPDAKPATSRASAKGPQTGVIRGDLRSLTGPQPRMLPAGGLPLMVTGGEPCARARLHVLFVPPSFLKPAQGAAGWQRTCFARKAGVSRPQAETRAMSREQKQDRRRTGDVAAGGSEPGRLASPGIWLAGSTVVGGRVSCHLRRIRPRSLNLGAS
jgi:hypothetical protein